MKRVNSIEGLALKAGLFLMPVGLLNETHEPPAFYGVERNEVETRIIPTTWREGGFSIGGAIHQELQKAKAYDPALYGAVSYRGLAGLLVGGSSFTGNSVQGNAAFIEDSSQPDLGGARGRVTLWDVHSRWTAHRLDVSALYAQGTIGDTAEINRAFQAYNTLNPGADQFALVPTQFYGWFGSVVKADYQKFQDNTLNDKFNLGIGYMF